MRSRLLLLPLLSLTGLPCLAGEPAVDFSRDVRPILSDKCFKCHGPDDEARQADLRLDRPEEADYAISPGEPEQSELLRRVGSDDADERMPPPDSNLELSSDEIGTLRRWIAAGAPHEQHWAFRPVRQPPPPGVSRGDWPRNAIDRFVLARLEKEGLSPTPAASRERLIRRLSFDLTGLPPSLEEIDAFLADDSPRAYERLADRLLESQAYGERMTADWLDIARYSDTYGYQVDRDRFVWPWRDWVIKSFNDNLPYDQFVTWQLAGDLLEDATDEQILATTFCRLHPQKVEGGSVPEEFRVEYVADRNHTFATALLGLTLECARCHDHKYDPISQREYYQLFAFFNSIDEAGLYSFFTPAVPTPTMLLADEPARRRIAEAEAQIASAEKALAETAASRSAAFHDWLAGRPSEAATPGRVAHLDFESGIGGGNRSVAGKIGRAVQLSGDDGIGLSVGNFRRFEPFSVSLWMNTPDVKERAVVFHRSRAWTDAGSRGYELLIEEGRLSAALIHFWPGNALRVMTGEAIPANEWLHVALTYDGSSRAGGLRIFVNGQEAETETVRDNLYKNITGGGGDNITIGERFRDRGFAGGLVDEFSVFARELTPLEVEQLHDGQSLVSALSKPEDKLSARDRAELLAYYLATADADFAAGLKSLRDAREAGSAAVDNVAEIMVMREMPRPRPTFRLKRGAYDAPQEEVFPAAPAVFPPLPAGAPTNRLGLALWLTAPDHPLTARVAVDRLWRMCFGHGLVRTPEDFGSQGEPPTHPELLDWLAADFVQGGWDVKRTLKLIVMSAAYRQDSRSAAETAGRDPDNRLLARGPRNRLSAEMIRDNALAASGLLVQKIGGPPVRPYEVEAAFKPVGRDKGEGLYRRSLYTYWKRTGPAPVMMSLDASKRDVCTVKRERTSTPLQSLVLLNGPQFVEAARVLGERMVEKHGDDAAAIIVEVFRRLTGRRPGEREMSILSRLHSEQLAHFQDQPGEAEKLLAAGDWPPAEALSPARAAAACVLALAIMNFDECLVKR